MSEYNDSSSQNSDYLQKYILNHIFVPKHFLEKLKKDHHFLKLSPHLTLPNNIDLRNIKIPVLDQGDFGTCVANTISSAIMYRQFHHLPLKKNEIDNIYISSRLFFYTNYRIDNNIPLTDDPGADYLSMFQSIEKYKFCKEQIWPYIPENFSLKPSKIAYEEASKNENVKHFFITDSIKHHEIEIKSALFNKYPIVFGIIIFESFYKIKQDGLVPIPDFDNEEILGGHALLLIGFDDDKKVWIVQNSWSEKFGDNGFIYIPYDLMLKSEFASEFFAISIYS